MLTNSNINIDKSKMVDYLISQNNIYRRIDNNLLMHVYKKIFNLDLSFYLNRFNYKNEFYNLLIFILRQTSIVF